MMHALDAIAAGALDAYVRGASLAIGLVLGLALYAVTVIRAGR